jgi:RNA polymerase sigma factor (sigma-70 family)
MASKRFDLEKFARYQAETDPRIKQRLEGELLVENMPFVKMQAAKYLKRSTIKSDIEDLVQAGALGLLRTIRKFDPTKAAFTTYAGWWILRELQTVTAKEQPVNRPKGAGMSYLHHRQYEALEAQGQTPEDKDLGLSPGTIDAWLQSPAFFPLDDERKDGYAFANQIQDPESLLAKEEANHVIGTLTEKERRMLEKHYLEGVGQPIEEVRKVVEKLKSIVGACE